MFRAGNRLVTKSQPACHDMSLPLGLLCECCECMERNEMSRMLPYPVQRQVCRSASCLSAVLLSGAALFGQFGSPSRPNGWDRQLPSHPLPEWSIVSEEPAQPHAGSNRPSSNTVTFQELHHKVPRKARKEMEKAERARNMQRTDDAVAHFNQAISIRNS